MIVNCNPLFPNTGSLSVVLSVHMALLPMLPLSEVLVIVSDP